MKKGNKGVLGVYLINIDDKNNKYELYTLEENTYRTIIKNAEKCTTTFQINQFVDTYGIRPQDIIVHGDTEVWNSNDANKIAYREQTTALLKSILPKPKHVKDPIRNIVRDSYKCYCAKEFGLEDVCEHKTPWDSWRCLMIRLNNPKYCIVVKSYNKK